MAIVKPTTDAELFPVARAGNAWRFDAGGALVQAGANLSRVDYDPVTLAARGALFEEAATNLSGNPRFEGAVAGVPGTAPTGQTWLTTGAGVTREIVGTGIEDGLPYVDVRWSGTPSSSTSRTHNFVTNAAVAAAAGQSWASEVAARVVAGSTTNVTVTHSIIGLDSGGAATNQGNFVITGAVTAPALRSAIHVGTLALVSVTTAFVQHRIILGFTLGQAADITLRMAAPQLWQSAVAFSPTLPPASAPGPSSRAADDCAAAAPRRWLNAAAGTFVVEVTPGQVSAGNLRGVVSIDDGTATNRIALRLLAGNTNARLSADIGGVQVAAADQATGAALARHTLRCSYGPAGYLLSVNGAAPVVAAGAIPPGLARVLRGRAETAGQYLNGWIGPRFEYYPVQYTDTPAADGFTIRTR